MAGARQPRRKKVAPSAADALRQDAEERLDRLSADAASPVPEDVAAVVHDLLVHQIELEMQNETMRETLAKLEDSRQMYVDLYDTIPVGHVTVDRDGLILRANLSLADVLGTPRDSLIGRSMTALVDKDDQDAYYLLRRRLLATAQPQEAVFRLVDADGRTFWVQARAVTTGPGAATPGACEIALTDVTARIEAEEDLKTASRELDALYNHAPCAYHSLDADGLFTRVNDTELSWLGYSRDEMVGRMHFPDILTPDGLPTFAVNFPEFKRRGFVYGLEFVLKRKDGTTIPALLNSVAIKDSGGRFLYSLSTMVDIAAITRAHDEIRRLNVTLEDRVVQRTTELTASIGELESFAYSVAHDLRAPLRALDGFSRMLLDDYGDGLDATAREYLGRIREADQNMAALIDGLLELSRLTRSELRRQTVDLSELACEIVAELREAAPDRRVEVAVGVGLQAHADRDLTRVLLANLIGNAWKFTSKHECAKIEVGAVVNEGERVFFVRDDGAGFDMRYVDKLFGAFERLHAADEFEGTGIGLATVQRIVHRHGGRAWAEGALDKGATFWFTLPDDADMATAR